MPWVLARNEALSPAVARLLVTSKESFQVLEGRSAISYQPQIIRFVVAKGNTMANEKSTGHPAMDYNEHNRTYDGFLRITKIGIVLLVLLLLAMRYFLIA
jgi:Bacterial aa3 type cytochrome c oxidase subunit IV